MLDCVRVEGGVAVLGTASEEADDELGTASEEADDGDVCPDGQLVAAEGEVQPDAQPAPRGGRLLDGDTSGEETMVNPVARSARFLRDVSIRSRS